MKLKFQIRDIFWLMVVVACCLLWWREHAEVIQWRAQSEQEAARARAMMDFLNQSMSTITAPPTAPQTPTDQGPIAPPERPNSDGLEHELRDRVEQLEDRSSELYSEPNRAGEDDPFVRPEHEVFSMLSPHGFESFTAPYFPLRLNGTDAELREHLGQPKR